MHTWWASLHENRWWHVVILKGKINVSKRITWGFIPSKEHTNYIYIYIYIDVADEFSFCGTLTKYNPVKHISAHFTNFFTPNTFNTTEHIFSQMCWTLLEVQNGSLPAWISNYMPSKVWNEITYPFLNFNGCAVVSWDNVFISCVWTR